jgi:GNAT superfamily N-acetyltransferase
MATTSIRLLQEHELVDANRTFRLAFGTVIGVPNPETYRNDVNYMNRWYNDPSGAFAAEVDGHIVGVNIAISWGSFGYFGPLAIHPDYWGHSIGKKLVQSVVDRFSDWSIQQVGFFHSPIVLSILTYIKRLDSIPAFS